MHFSVAASYQQQPLVLQSGLTSTQQKLEQCCTTKTLSNQQQPQAVALQQSTSGNQQQLQPGT